MPAILAFGDSVTYGYADSQGGWIQRLRAHVDELDRKKNDFTTGVYNLGSDSEDTSRLLERIIPEGEHRARVWKGITTIINGGINDCTRFDGKQAVGVEDFGNNLRELVLRAKTFSDIVILLGPNPIDDKLTNPVYWDKTISCKNDELRLYSQEVSKVALESKITFVDLFRAFSEKSVLSLINFDGVHPNDEGHELIYQLVRKELEKQGII